MRELDDARAHALALDDQEMAEAVDWFRMLMREQPGLLIAINKYLNRSVAEHGTELTSEQLQVLKRLARLGFSRVLAKVDHR